MAGLAVASGAAAISYTIQALAQNGGHVVAQKTIYGGSYNLLEHTLPNFGITATFVDAHNLKRSRMPSGEHPPGLPGNPGNPTLISPIWTLSQKSPTSTACRLLWITPLAPRT